MVMVAFSLGNTVHVSHRNTQKAKGRTKASIRRARMSETERRSSAGESGMFGGSYTTAVFARLERCVRRDGRSRLHVEGNLDLKDVEKPQLSNDDDREPLVEDGMHQAVVSTY